MKKLQILIPTLVATVSIPFISLVGCNKKNPKTEPKFSVNSGEMFEEKKAEIKLDWTNGDSIDFFDDSFEFKYNGGTKSATKVAISGEESRPQLLEIEFEDSINTKITDGVLTFDYQNNTTKVQTSGKVEEIKILNLFKPDDFNIQSSAMTTTTTASINLNWTPNLISDDEKIIFEEFTFNYDDEKTATVTPGTQQAGTQPLNLSFDTEILNDITDGQLTFKYKLNSDSGHIHEIDFPNDIEIKIPDSESFTVSSKGMQTLRTASIDLSWTSTHELELIGVPEFKYGIDKSATIEIVEPTPSGPWLFNLTFDEDIVSQNITDGILSFGYKDLTTGFEYDCSEEDINISKFTLEKDSWENVCSYANQGLDALKGHYGEESFIGVTKNIEIDGFTYELQIVGENEDYIANEEGEATTEPAALTFMFKTAIQKKNDQTGQFAPYLVNYTTEDDAFEDDFWQNSIPRNYLNNDFLPKLEEALGTDNVKTVSKNTISVFHTGEISSTAEKIFLPSLADIFSSNSETYQLPSIDDEDIKNKEAYEQEARSNIGGHLRYGYFDKIVDQSYNQKHQELAVYDGKDKKPENEVSYWLRSCCPSGGELLESRNEWMWCSSNAKEIEEEDKQTMIPITIWAEPSDTNFQLGMAPIFCI